MKTPEEIKKGLEHCTTDGADCTGCIYRDECMEEYDNAPIQRDALAYIQQLEDQFRGIPQMVGKDINVPSWISVEERLPKPETQVLILAKRGKYTVITNGMYEDGTLNTEDSDWHWYDNDFEYDEENDAYIIPPGWWEYKHYNGDDEYNHAIDDKVTHWMPLPEPPKEGS